MRLAELAGKRVVIWGIGREARSVIDAIERFGIDADLTAVDDSPTGDGAIGAVAVARGTEALSALRAADIVVRSPGISPYRDDVTALARDGKTFTTATDLWFSEGFDNVIGITGTKGKSTTSSLVARFLGSVGIDVVLAGNIGRSPIDLLGLASPDWWVVEFSSFQASNVGRSPAIGALTSLSPEHLDWHGDAETYMRDKLNLCAHSDTSPVVLNEYDAGVRASHDRVRGRLITAGVAPAVRVDGGSFVAGDRPLLPTDTCRLPGEHNKALTCVALEVIATTGVDLHAHSTELREALETFESLPHRLAPIAEVGGVTYVDDSIATTPIATIAALEAYADRQVTLIVGGHDRGVSYEDFGRYVADRGDRVKVIAIPESGRRIVECIARAGGAALVTQLDDLDTAVTVAARITPQGGAVLLSPAAPSFGQFRDYIDRAEHFASAVAAIPRT